MRSIPTALCVLLIGSTAFAGPAALPAFARKPTAARDGEKVQIDFAVDRETDVAVFIEDAQGRIVRHLVAGVLGLPSRNAPAPLAGDSLEQSIVWDGQADYGKPAGAGPFKVRVALGTGAKYDRIIAEEPQNFGNISGLATGPDGTLYVCCFFGAGVPNWGGQRIVALGRDGQYQRTVMPFSSSLSKAEVEGLGVIELEGRVAPVFKDVRSRSFYASESLRKAGMAVTPDGVILRPVGGYNGRGPLSLSAIGPKGNAPWGKELGGKLVDATRAGWGRPFVCVSSDGKNAYVAGMNDVRPGQKPGSVNFSCVYRAPLPERAPAKPFFGQPEEPGKDDAHLSDSPRGVAIDGKGNLLIADQGNNRVVVVDEKDGRLVGQFAVERPDGVAVDPAAGAVYVTHLVAKEGVELVKFNGWKEPKELAKATFPREGDSRCPWVMALDATAKGSPPIVWLASDLGSLMRVEDQGEKLTATKVNTGVFGSAAFEDLSVDRFRPDREIYARTGAGRWMRFNEASGKIEHVSTGTAVNEGVCILAGPDGNLYGPGYPYNLLRFTREGKRSPWPAGNVGYPPNKKGPVNGIYVPVSMVFMTHTLGIRQDGHLFVFEPGKPGEKPPKMLREYTPDGKRVSEHPIIWKTFSSIIGPKFDPQGNIYVAEQIKPVDQVYPPEFADVVGKVEVGKTYLQGQPVKDSICTMYGSILKFTPKGGTFQVTGENPYKGEAKLDPALKTMDLAYYTSYRLHPVKVTGAEWVRMGISHMDLHYCNCENVRFDVDEFGRVWYPDTARFRVGVLDTNGNDIAHFGGYGNAESRGPESKDKSLAEPDIALGWLVGVGVTDRYIYMGDSMSRRLLRAKIVYAAEETCQVK